MSLARLSAPFANIAPAIWLAKIGLAKSSVANLARGATSSHELGWNGHNSTNGQKGGDNGAAGNELHVDDFGERRLDIPKFDIVDID